MAKTYVKTLKIYINQNFFSLHSFNPNIKMLKNSAQPSVASSPGTVSYWGLEDLDKNIEDFSACLPRQMQFFCPRICIDYAAIHPILQVVLYRDEMFLFLRWAVNMFICNRISNKIRKKNE